AGMDELADCQFAPAKRFAAYLGGVVSAATAHLPGEVIATDLACHRRAGHKPCPGWLLVRCGPPQYRSISTVAGVTAARHRLAARRVCRTTHGRRRDRVRGRRKIWRTSSA